MILHEVELSQDYEYIEIKPIGDTHIGDAHFDEQLLMSDIEWIAEKENRFALLNGDIMNCATIHSVSDTYANTMSPHDELKYARKLFSPIADKILSANRGNHEYRIYKSDGLDVSEELALSLNTFYNAEGLVLKVKFGKRKTNGKHQVYTLYHSHGFSGARTVGGKANRLEKLRDIVLADVYILSHTHQMVTFPLEIKVPDLRNNKIITKEQRFVNTGAYLKYGGYGEAKAYNPTKKGSPVIRLWAEDKEINVVV